MDERKRQVLDAIIKDYITTAEPVGSRAVAKKYGLGVSPATIRNEMSDLEEQGYIEQPHTSSGRCPSDKGYRFYVDYLMEKEELTPHEISFITNSLTSRITEIEVLLRSACQMLSKLANYPAMVVLPKIDKGKLEKIQLVSLNMSQALVVVLSDTGVVTHKVYNLSQQVEPLKLAAMEKYLQSKLGGLQIDQLTYPLLKEIATQMGEHEGLFAVALELMDQVLLVDTEEKVFTSGSLNMLEHPEFRDTGRLKNVLGFLEQETRLADILKPLKSEKGTSVTIGMELPYETIKNCSMIVSAYGEGGSSESQKNLGIIGVIGPTRMSYSKTISIVDFISGELNKLFSRPPNKHKY